MERLYPDPAPTSVAAQTAAVAPFEDHGSRPHVFTNFAATVDGHATISGVSGKIGGDTDTAMLMGLREAADAVMVGAGTIRAEQYGRLLPGAERRQRREQRGLASDPLAVVISNRLDLPWDVDLFTSGAGRVVVFTASADTPPATATPLEVVRHEDAVDLGAALADLRARHGVAGLLCEGGPHLHGSLLTAGLVDELFVTLGAKLAGGEGPRIAEGLAAQAIDVELLWLLREGSELFARYAIRK